MSNNYTEYSRNLMLEALPENLFITLHDADPGQTGANVTPGTTREPVTILPAADGERLAVEEFIDVDVPQGETVAFVGVWDDETAGNFIAGVEVTEVTFAQNSVYRVTNFSLDLNLVCSV